MLYDIAKKTASPIYFDIDPYSFSIYGNRIIYNDMFNGMFTGMYDIATKKHINLPFTYVSDPNFYGNKVVYDEQRNIGGYDIYIAQI